MSTIASPRTSISSIQTTATDTTTVAGAGNTDRTAARRNKAAALRDYYNLRSPPQTSAPPSPNPDPDIIRPSDLDKPDFDLQTYVTDLLTQEGLQGILKVEAGLLSEIRTLDGEKKALVYDNYSKLISATETIRRMREKMDPLTPTTSTLTPAIDHIAETASTLSQDLRRNHSSTVSSNPEGGVEATQNAERERNTVRWALNAPPRLKALRESGKGDEAEKEWKVVEGLLGKWSAVPGVEELRKRCLEALEGEGG